MTISYLWPFGCTSYAHVPLDLNQFKLNPRLVKITLLGYFEHNGYKLLDKSTGAIFKSRDVIFEEGITHLAKQSTPTVLSDDNNLFATRLQQNGNVGMVKDNPKPEPILLPTHGIVLRPLPSSEPYGTDNDNTPDTNNSTPTTTENPNNDPDNLPLCHKLHSAISPSILHRFSRSQWLRKSLEKTFR